MKFRNSGIAPFYWLLPSNGFTLVKLIKGYLILAFLQKKTYIYMYVYIYIYMYLMVVCYGQHQGPALTTAKRPEQLG